MKSMTLTMLLLIPAALTLEQGGLTASSSSSSQVDFSKAQITTKSIQAEPKIITQRYSAEPKVITERIVGKPQIVTEENVEPLRQRIVIQPQINQKIEQLIPEFIPEKDRVVERQRQLPVQTQSELKPRTVTIDGDKAYYQTIIQPKVNKITEQLNVIEGGEVKQTLEPIYKKPEVEQFVNTREFPLPANKYVSQPIIQPIVEKESIKVSFVPGQDKVVERQKIEREPLI